MISLCIIPAMKGTLKDGTIKVCDIKSINNGMLNITQTK